MKKLTFALVVASLAASALPGAALARNSRQLNKPHTFAQDMKKHHRDHCKLVKKHVKLHGHWTWQTEKVCG